MATIPVLVTVFLLGLVGVSAAGTQTFTATGSSTDGSLVTRFDTSGTFDGSYLFDVELWNGGTRVYQDWETRTVHGSSSESLTRALPAGLNGSYTVRAGVFSPDWSVKYLYTDNAGTVAVSPLTFTARAGGSDGALQTVFTAGQRTGATLMFDVELWNGGNRAYQYYETGTLTEGGSYTLNRTLPTSLAKGTYTVRAGVFSANWATRYLWTDNAGSIGVAGPAPVPTFTGGSSISGSTFRTVFTASTTSSQNFLFDVELWDGAGNRVYQSTDTGPVTGSTVTVTRTLPARIASGTYTAKVGVYSSDWSNGYLWNGNAGTLTVATGGSAPLTVAATTTLAGGTLQTALAPSRPLSGQFLVDVELWNGGNRVYQTYSPVNLSATPAVTLTRPLPSSVPRGTYTARVGLFTPDWSSRYAYADAGTVTVGATATPSPGAVQVTSSPGTLTAGFTAPSGFPADAVYDVEVWDRAGLRVAQSLTRPSGGSGSAVTATMPVPAALGIGGYTVRAGVLSADLRTALFWNESAGALTVSSPPAGTPDRSGPLGPANAAGSWRLAFGDEFNADSLDAARWSTCSRQMFVTRNQCFGHNEELQTYLPGGVSMTSADDARGVRLTARNDGSSWNFAHDAVTAGAPLWTSGMISTGPAVAGVDPPGYTPFSFTYGYFEVRMKVPAGQGLWPAAWLFPADNTGPAEIDLSEVLGHDPATTYMSVHYPGGHSTESSTGVDLSRGFHTYGVDWEPDRITWYIDGVAARSTYSGSGIPNRPMYPMINLAVGGSWPGSPDASTPSSASTVIDWVRVWQH